MMRCMGVYFAVCLAMSCYGLLGRAFGQGDLTPMAGPSPTMKTLDQVEPRTPISSLPYTIQSGGSYYLTRSLNSSSQGIVINVSNVTLDLMGFTISGDSGGNDEDGVIIKEEKDFLELKKKKLNITDNQHFRLEIEVLLEMGRQALDKERLDDSINFIKQVIDKGEDDGETYDLYACLLVLGGDYDTAKETIAKCAELASKEDAEEGAPDEPGCPDCSASIRHIEQYDRWYCDACKKYLPKDFKPGGAKEEAAAAPPAEPEPKPEEKKVDAAAPPAEPEA